MPTINATGRLADLNLVHGWDFRASCRDNRLALIVPALLVTATSLVGAREATAVDPWPLLAVFDLDPPLARVKYIEPIIDVARQLDAALTASHLANPANSGPPHEVLDFKLYLLRLELTRASVKRESMAALASVESHIHALELLIEREGERRRTSVFSDQNLGAAEFLTTALAQLTWCRLAVTLLSAGPAQARARVDQMVPTTSLAALASYCRFKARRSSVEHFARAINDQARGELFIATQSGREELRETAFRISARRHEVLRRITLAHTECFLPDRHFHSLALAEEQSALARLPRPRSDRWTTEALAAAAYSAAQEHFEFEMGRFKQYQQSSLGLVRIWPAVSLLARCAYLADQAEGPESTTMRRTIEYLNGKFDEVIFPAVAEIAERDAEFVGSIDDLDYKLVARHLGAWTSEYVKR